MGRGEFDMALECYQGCEEIRTAKHGLVSRHVADVIMAQGKVQSDIERGMLAVGASLNQLRLSVNSSDTAEEQDGALDLFKKALQIYCTINGPNSIYVATTLEKIGMAQFRVGKLVSARKYLEDSVEVYRKCGKK